MGPRYARKMSYSTADVVKIIVLVAAFAYLTYDGASRFITVPQAQVQVRVNPDYGACNALVQCTTCTDKDLQVPRCRAEVAKVFTEAEQKCRGYINNLQKCKNQRQGQCQVEAQSADSCLSAVTSKVLGKWWAVAKGEGRTSS